MAKVKIVLNTEQKLAGHKQRILLNEHKLYQLSTTSVRNSKCSCYVLEESVTIITYFTFVYAIFLNYLALHTYVSLNQWNEYTKGY